MATFSVKGNTVTITADLDKDGYISSTGKTKVLDHGAEMVSDSRGRVVKVSVMITTKNKS